MFQPHPRAGLVRKLRWCQMDLPLLFWDPSCPCLLYHPGQVEAGLVLSEL